MDHITVIQRNLSRASSRRIEDQMANSTTYKECVQDGKREDGVLICGGSLPGILKVRNLWVSCQSM